ncbi:hypothetical protein HXX76_003014 [Chlamydomonas incerta]|uniref:BTB domain-containing protein n=1 Tax=Chlamydomonas incerta TaxID=51695 RepID=A0A835TG93_CHLIN|nr:hypothetical protein HXX76_003014 [Chlamydomonas incerta]|eukprot:KAG2442938.1 hypothetical protein HXX76_003014 [Chlamydomonas incerta]
MEAAQLDRSVSPPGSCLITLAFRDSNATGAAAAAQPPAAQVLLQVDRALLWHASPVLRGAIEDTCSGNGGNGGSDPQGAATPPTLTLLGDSAADWQGVVEVLQDATSPISWDNVGPLLRLADKYDMAAVRRECVSFLALHAPQMSLTHPLACARNPLCAASLVEWHVLGGNCNSSSITAAGDEGGAGGGAGGGGAGGGDSSSSSSCGDGTADYVATISAALTAALKPLGAVVKVPKTCKPTSAGATAAAANTKKLKLIRYSTKVRGTARLILEQLTKLTQHPRYEEAVAKGVQRQVTAALLACLKDVAAR